MKRIQLFVALIATAAVLSLTSCATDSSGNLANFWNSPAMQAELTTIQTAAFAFINGWINSHTGAMSSAGGNTAAADACYADLKAKFPHTPDVVLRGAADKAARGR